MNSKEGGEPKLQIHQIVLLVAAVTGGVWLYQGPLKSSRPVQDMENKSAMEMGEERVQARLWQDPFEAVETHLKYEDSKSGGRSAPGEKTHFHLLTRVAEEVATSTPTPRDIQILVILTDGSPYADNRESRLRHRFAVLAGLDRAGYTPRNGEYVRFFHWSETDTCQSTSAEYQHISPLWAQQLSSRVKSYSQAIPIRFDNCRPSTAGYWRQAPVPVEWYQSVPDGKSHVLIFWIKDQDLGDQPLNSLHEIHEVTKRSFMGLHSNLTFRVIGPRFSGTLQAMLADKVNEPRFPETFQITTAVVHRDNDVTFEMYSPWSTAPEEHLTDWKESIEDQFKNRKVTFIRTIPTDAELVDALAGELSRRGAKLKCTQKNDCAHIAVISEWDTLYGRTLPAIFKPRASYPENLHRYSYLRGLDGELPHSKQKSDKDTPADNKNSSMYLFREQQEVESMEAPDGRSQLDYLRRLTQVIKEKDDELRACSHWKSKCPRIKAIGVLGSDVYDKLLVLQALKKSFPEVLFFTTDLDARLFHPTQLTWTRNLVVASHFDLKLNDKLQGEIPPFRDTYQTATMLAILRALGTLKETTKCPGALQFRGPNQTDCFAKSAQIKLHEIGRNGPVDISVHPPANNQVQSPQTVSTVRPAPLNLGDALTKTFQVIAYFLVLTVLLIPASAFLYGWVVKPLLSPSSISRTAIAAGFVFILALADLLFGGLFYLTSDSYEGEPFSFFDGVSIWPSQILRGMVGTLSVLFLWWIYTRSHRACEELGRQLCEVKHTRPSNSTTQSPPLLRILLIKIRIIWNIALPLKGIATRLSRISISNWARTELAAEENILAIWRQYRRRLYLRRIITRVGFWSLVFWITGWLILAITGMPATPFRGPVAERVNLWLLQPAVLGMIAVIFLVLDVTKLTGVFVRKLIPEELKELPIDELMTRLRIIARLTSRIDAFIYYPAGLIVLMLLARSDYIDNWDFPIGLMIVIGLSASYVIVSAFQLRRDAERARRRVLDELSRLRWNTPTSTSGLEKEVQQAIDEANGLTEGAFMPITELPAFRAVTLPTGFYAVLTLIETFAKN